MTVKISADHGHWNYLLALDEDLARLSRFVDFSGNGSAYSLEIARILMAASAEVDVVLKLLCAIVDPGKNPGSINAYHPIVVSAFPRFRSFGVKLPRFGIDLRPWTSWKADASPKWWTANNKIKHQRDAHFKEANLKHCLNSVAGLYVVVLHLYREEAIEGALQGLPRVLNVADKYFGGTVMGRWGHSFRYRIPEAVAR